MRELEMEFDGKGDVKGFYFHQLKANEGGFLYKVTQSGTPHPHFEVFKKRVSKPHPRAISNEWIELYPTANSFGFWAWSCKNFQEGKEKFSAITDASTDKGVKNQNHTK